MYHLDQCKPDSSPDADAAGICCKCLICKASGIREHVSHQPPQASLMRDLRIKPKSAASLTLPALFLCIVIAVCLR